MLNQENANKYLKNFMKKEAYWFLELVKKYNKVKKIKIK